jgi:ClpP class serine protease
VLSAVAAEYHRLSKQAVLCGRLHVRPDAACFDGRVMTATQAIRVGLIDAVGYLPDALPAADPRRE